jgi:hypothetical protein
MKSVDFFSTFLFLKTEPEARSVLGIVTEALPVAE